MGAAPGSSHPKPLRIGEVAERLGLNAKTIRYYETIGLLPEPRRTRSNYRLYDELDVERLRFIRTAQRFGLRLDDIAEILALRDRGERPCDHVLELVHREVGDLDRRIEDLRRVRDELVTLVALAERLPPRDEARFCPLIEHRAAEREGYEADEARTGGDTR